MHIVCGLSFAHGGVAGWGLYYLLGRRLSFPVIRSCVGVRDEGCVCQLVVCDETLCCNLLFLLLSYGRLELR